MSDQGLGTDRSTVRRRARPVAAVVALTTLVAVVALVALVPGPTSAGAQGSPATTVPAVPDTAGTDPTPSVDDDDGATDAGDDGPVLRVELPLGDGIRRGGGAAVAVTLTAPTQLVRGELRLRSEPVEDDLFGGGRDGFGPVPSGSPPVATEPATLVVPVEVAAGATWEGAVVLPVLDTSLSSWFGMGRGVRVEVAAELLVDGQVVARDRTTRQVDPVGRDVHEVIGLLPATAGRGTHPEELALLDGEDRLGSAVLVELDPDLLAAGPGAYDGLAQVVGTAEDVAALDPVARAGLEAWLLTGGHLVVEGGADGLPDALHPGDVTWRRVGAGDVRVLADVLDEETWSLVARPTTAGDPRRVTGLQAPGAVYSESLALAPTTSVLGRDAGFRLPDVDPLVVLLVAYAVVAGPVAFVVLRRRGQTTAAWVVLPAIAGVASVGFAVVGAGLRPTAEATHATVVELTPEGAVAATTVMIGSVPGGSVALELPRGWSPQGTGGGEGGLPLVLAGDATTVPVELEAGAVEVVRATGPVAVEGTLDVTPRLVVARDGDQVVDRHLEVELANRTGADLEDVVALVGQQAVGIDDLADGEVATARVPSPLAVDRAIGDGGDGQVELGRWPGVAADLRTGLAGMCNGTWCQQEVVCDVEGCWPRPTEEDEIDPTASAVSSVAWTDFVRHDDLAVRRPDVVTVVGWTRQLPAPAALDGRPVTTGRTAVVRRAAVAGDGLDVTDLRRERIHDVRTTMSLGEAWVGQRQNEIPVESRVLLPERLDGAPTDPSSLALRVPGAAEEVSFWVDGGWVTYVRRPFDVTPMEVPVPPEAVVAGVVHVRTLGDVWDVGLGGNAEELASWSVRPIDGAERAALEAARAEDAAIRAAVAAQQERDALVALGGGAGPAPVGEDVVQRSDGVAGGVVLVPFEPVPSGGGPTTTVAADPRGAP